jgi:hypothetical protein
MLNIRQADMLFFIGNRLRTTLPRRRLNGQLTAAALACCSATSNAA